MKIGIIVETRYLSQHMPMAVISLLQARNSNSIDLINPDNGYFSVDTGVFVDANGLRFSLRDYDLVVSRNRNPLGLVLLRYIEELGIPAINSHSAVQKVRNKAKMAASLAIGGVRAAPTLLAGDTHSLSAHLNTQFPIILKATYGDNCQGLQLVRDSDELSDLNWSSDVVVAQNYYRNDGYDLKLYVCGEHIYAVRKPSPFNGDPGDPSIPVSLTPELASLAKKCGEIFGLQLYGVDCIETEEGPLVIEVNDYPNYSGIPGIGDLVADYILSQGERVAKRL